MTESMRTDAAVSDTVLNEASMRELTAEQTSKNIPPGKIVRAGAQRGKLNREQLHEYQNYACEFLKTHVVAALFLDMGLGKSIITLTALLDLILDYAVVGKVLIIAPLRVARDTWPNELKKWSHLENLDMSVMVGTEKQRIKALQTPSLIYTINRENVKWLVDYYEKNDLTWDFDTVVIDELSSFKNTNTQRWKALWKVRPLCRRMIGLTGTPAPGGMFDLWAEIKMIDQGARLGRYITKFRERFFRPVSFNPTTKIVYEYSMVEGADQKIYDRISDICISMKALDYLDMPEFLDLIYPVQMSEREKDQYDQLKRDLILPMVDGDVEAANAAALSNKLLQMANGAVYDENHIARHIHDRKLDALEDLIESANGQSVLIGYWFQHDRGRIMRFLEDKGMNARELRGSQDFDDWNAGKIPIALIHPASAGHGLNIQDGGHILIWFGMTWSLELYQQTNARLWRQGQKNTVSVYHIVTLGTIDEKVMHALEAKTIRQEDLIDAVKAQLG